MGQNLQSVPAKKFPRSNYTFYLTTFFEKIVTCIFLKIMSCVYRFS